MSEKSILEQALLQVQTLEEAVKQNAKGILASTMKQELNELLKESKEEEKDVKEQPSDEEGGDDISDEEGTSDDEGVSDEDMPSDDEDETSDDESENEDDPNNEPVSDESDVDSTEMPSDDLGSDEVDSTEMPSDDLGSDDVLDLTAASDEEVLKVFKAMKPEDGVVVKKDGDQLDVDMGDEEYIIKLDDENEVEEEALEVDDPMMEPSEGMSMNEPTEETIYEIELSEDDDKPTEGGVEENEKEPTEGEEKEVEATEAARTKWNIHGDKNEGNRAGLKSKKVFKAGAINEEVENLKKQNAEYKKALVLFKDKLNEVAVFNASLAYATRLFTEHSTTKQEKLNILKRFDSISSINEAKSLFNTIKAELDTKKPVTETVVEKISNTPKTSSSQEMLAEAKAYENPQFKRMKDLMGKLK